MIKFRLSQKDNNEYLDLFPKTSVDAIANGDSILGIQVLEIDIPATNNTTQTIAIQTNKQIVDAPFEVHYISGNRKDFNTISQAKVSENTLTITRLHNMPNDAIKVALVFYGMGV